MIDDQSSSHHTLKGCDDDDVMIVSEKKSVSIDFQNAPYPCPRSLPNQRQQSGDVDEVQRGLVASLASTNVGGT